MGSNSRKTTLGNYICKIGKYDIRQKIEQPRTKKLQGRIDMVPGSKEASICQGRNVIEKGFKDCVDAIKKAYELVVKNGEAQNVCKRTLRKYKIS
jgi:hypothetical protein|tara:strand:+ start:1630 stop:1914 length:285 start_codon:yes stop_codon:yes gene_type:complete